MFNLLPGQGLGFTGSKLIAFGLGSMVLKEIPLPLDAGGGGSFRNYVRYYDDVYSVQEDDEDIMEVLMLLFEVLE
jgi:hypothetical protein